MPPERRHFFISFSYLPAFSHFWLAMPQLVLQADWQEVWHSPQPPCLALSQRLRVSSVLILSMIQISISAWAFTGDATDCSLNI
jgi:hypothetical protein